MAKAKAAKNEGLVKRSSTTALQPWEQDLAKEARDERSKETLGVPRITHRGGVFKIDDQPVGQKLTLAIVDWKFEKAYFEGKFDPSKPATPDCYAFGSEEKGMIAHEAAPHKQHLQPDGTSPCDGCKHNAFNTAEVGRGKRCKDYRRLLVISPIMGTDGKPRLDPESVQKTEIRQLSVPPASLKNWGNYLTSLKPVEEGGLGLTRTGSAREMIVEVNTYALDSGGHGLNFKPVQQISSEALQAILARRTGSAGLLMQAYPNIDAEGKTEPEAAPRSKKSNKKLD